MARTRTTTDWPQRKKDLRTLRRLSTDKPFIAYAGWTGHGNLGDDAVFEAYQAGLAPRPVESIATGRVLAAAEKIMGRRLNAVGAALGGGTLINQSESWLRIMQQFSARQVPSFCIGTGVASSSFWAEHPGVHQTGLMAEWAKVLREFVYVGVRGPRSAEMLRTVGVTSEVVGDSSLMVAPAICPDRHWEGTVGINVSNSTDGVMYGDLPHLLAALAPTIKAIIARGAVVKLLPIWPGDLEACVALEQTVADSACTLSASYSSVEAYLAELDTCDIFIGQKLHSVILAATLRIPHIMLAYRPKCLDFMESIHFENFAIRTDHVDPDVLLETIDLIIDTYAQLVTRLDGEVSRYRALQRRRAETMLRHVELEAAT